MRIRPFTSQVSSKRDPELFVSDPDGAKMKGHINYKFIYNFRTVDSGCRDRLKEAMSRDFLQFFLIHESDPFGSLINSLKFVFAKIFTKNTNTPCSVILRQVGLRTV